MGKRKPIIGQAQLELLQYVAAHEPVSVREVADHMAETAGKARTTILTLMEQLRQKGFLKRKKAAGLYRYSATARSSGIMRRLVKDFVENTLRGSVSPFVAYVVEEACLTDEEFAELKQLIDDLEARRKEHGQ